MSLNSWAFIYTRRLNLIVNLKDCRKILCATSNELFWLDFSPHKKWMRFEAGAVNGDNQWLCIHSTCSCALETKAIVSARVRARHQRKKRGGGGSCRRLRKGVRAHPPARPPRRVRRDRLPDQCEILIFHLGARVGGEEQKEAHSTHFILAASAEWVSTRHSLYYHRCANQQTDRPTGHRVGAN